MADVLTPSQAATELGVTRATVEKWCRDRVLTHTRTPRGHIRIQRDALSSMARPATKRPAAPALAVKRLAEAIVWRGESFCSEAETMADCEGE